MKTFLFCLSLNIAAPLLLAVEPGFSSLFDGISTHGWTTCGAGKISLEQGAARTSVPPNAKEQGCWWYEAGSFQDFVLRLEYLLEGPSSDSGVFLHFPNPGNDADSMGRVHQGPEIQILGTAMADYPSGSVTDSQTSSNAIQNPPGAWNTLEVQCIGPVILVQINGACVNRHEMEEDATLRRSGHIGIQMTRAGSVRYRNIRIKEFQQIPGDVSTLRRTIVGPAWDWPADLKEYAGDVRFLPDGGVVKSWGKNVWKWEPLTSHVFRIRDPGTKKNMYMIFDDDFSKFQGLGFHRNRQHIGSPLRNHSAPPPPAITPAPPAPMPATMQTDPNQPRIEVVKDQGPNAAEWALAALDEAIPTDIRQNLALLREDLLDEGAKGAKAGSEAYQLASDYCDKLLAALDQRDLARVNAGYAAAQADANKRISNQALDARRNHQMSWPQ